ncbi:MAG: helix-turn-helix domain-containing protein [Pyrodictiaceae archaeon]
MTREEVFEFIEKLLGEEARRVLEVLLDEPREMTEAEIAEKAGLRISSVRRALNSLAEKNLAIYRRIRLLDKARIVFYWRANPEGLQSIIMSRKKAVIEKLKTVLEHEKSTYYYICPFDRTRYTLDEAMEYNFTCPRCGSPLEPDEEREARIRILEDTIKRLEESLG